MGMPYVSESPDQQLTVNELLAAGFRFYGVTSVDHPAMEADVVLTSGGVFAFAHWDGSVSTYTSDGSLIRGGRMTATEISRRRDAHADGVRIARDHMSMTAAERAEWDGE